MHFLLFLLFPVLAFSSVEMTGHDIRSKKDKYLLVIGEENIVLMEREYKLYSLIKQKKKLLKKGAVVLLKENPYKYTLFVYANEYVSIQFGNPPVSKKKKQVVVFKFKPDRKGKQKTLVFESPKRFIKE